MADRSAAQLDSSQRKAVLLDIIGLAGDLRVAFGGDGDDRPVARLDHLQVLINKCPCSLSAV